MLAWGVYWNVMRAQADAAPRQIVDALRSAGWEAWIGPVQTNGFPARTAVSVTSPRITSPSGDWTWSAPELKGTALIYRTDHLVIDWSDRQDLKTPIGDLGIAAANMRSSLSFDLGPASTPLQRLSLEAANASFVAPAASGFAGALEAHLARPAAAASDHTGYNLFASIRNLSLRGSPTTEAPPAIERFEVNGGVLFAAPPGRTPLRAPRVARIDVAAAQITWAGAEIDVSGAIDIDAEGAWGGAMDVKASNATALLERLAALGVIQQQTALELDLFVSADADLEGTLTIEDGIARFEGVRVFRPAE